MKWITRERPKIDRIACPWLIRKYIDADLSFSLSDISRELDLNPTYLSREFPKYFDNMSYGEYIRKLRVEKAKDLLVNTNYKLTQIAYLSGFSNQSHFTKIFKEVIEKSPSNYRKGSQETLYTS